MSIPIIIELGRGNCMSTVSKSTLIEKDKKSAVGSGLQHTALFKLYLS